MSSDFVDYQKQVKENCAVLARALLDQGYSLVSGGTDNHLLLLDLRPKGVDGARAELVMEACGITVNKNTVPGDTKPLVPGGLRIGTPALTTRGLGAEDFKQVAKFLHKAVQLTAAINRQGANSGSLKLFRETVAKGSPEQVALRNEVTSFASSFPMPY
jgi:glycine hydroxymethyltransferase